MTKLARSPCGCNRRRVAQSQFGRSGQKQWQRADAAHTHSTSHRQPRTYSPAGVPAGTSRTSTTLSENGRSPEHWFVLPGSATESQGGSNSQSPAVPTEPFCAASGSGLRAQVMPVGSSLSAVMAATEPLV